MFHWLCFGLTHALFQDLLLVLSLNIWEIRKLSWLASWLMAVPTFIGGHYAKLDGLASCAVTRLWWHNSSRFAGELYLFVSVRVARDNCKGC